MTAARDRRVLNLVRGAGSPRVVYPQIEAWEFMRRGVAPPVVRWATAPGEGVHVAAEDAAEDGAEDAGDKAGTALSRVDTAPLGRRDRAMPVPSPAPVSARAQTLPVGEVSDAGALDAFEWVDAVASAPAATLGLAPAAAEVPAAELAAELGEVPVAVGAPAESVACWTAASAKSNPAVQLEVTRGTMFPDLPDSGVDMEDPSVSPLARAFARTEVAGLDDSAVGGEATLNSDQRDDGAGSGFQPSVLPSLTAEHLEAQGERWLKALPVAVRPLITAKRHPHIVNKMARLWDRSDALGAYMDELLISSRPGRRGFAMEVLEELVDLQRALQERGRI